MTKPKKDYFKLPFEVFYSQMIPVTKCEFKSDVDVKKFKDIKAMHQEEGKCWGVTFSCSKNNGPELYCCISNLHDEVHPSWLVAIGEEDVSFNHGKNFTVGQSGRKITFKNLQNNESTESYVDIDSMDDCCEDVLFAYHLDQSSPDYIVLDANNSRIKVDLDGYVLDENDSPTTRRIFNSDELDEEKYEDYSFREFYDLKAEWINNVFARNFPKEKPLIPMDW